MGPRDLLRLVSGQLTCLGIRHFVTGSMGSMAYGEYRSTIDVDLVTDLRPPHLKALAEGVSVPVASPEDIILMKLRYFAAGGSDKHLRDIAGILRVMRERIDRDYIDRWALELGVMEQWRAVSNASA